MLCVTFKVTLMKVTKWVPIDQFGHGEFKFGIFLPTLFVVFCCFGLFVWLFGRQIAVGEVSRGMGVVSRGVREMSHGVREMYEKSKIENRKSVGTWYFPGSGARHRDMWSTRLGSNAHHWACLPRTIVWGFRSIPGYTWLSFRLYKPRPVPV